MTKICRKALQVIADSRAYIKDHTHMQGYTHMHTLVCTQAYTRMQTQARMRLKQVKVLTLLSSYNRNQYNISL